MSDELNKKIKQITDILGQENIPDNIKGLLSLLATPGVKDETPSKAGEAPPGKDDRAGKNELLDNAEMIYRVRKIMDKLNTANNDPRINLLNAIRPFLNSTRQKKLNTCLKILQLSYVAKLMEEYDKGS